ncbi:MAG: phosphoenolpyruvate--protein phosphotransferase [Planctomycetales bacterium]|nr:phosphoenolpyruvate--protein phosphotransferase [Planctomycetales bacterium]
MEHMEGKTLSPGLAKGVAILVGHELQRTIELPQLNQPDSILRANVHGECERMDDALERSRQDLGVLCTLANCNPSIASAVELVSAHAAMASEIASLVKERISSNLVGVEEALDSVICQMVSRLQKIDSDYLREREVDVRDVGQRMMRHLIGVTLTSKVDFPSGSVIVARELVPSDAIALANSGVVGIVTQFGGKLGHTAIIARSLGIPAVSGILDVSQRITSGMTVLIDGEAGTVTTEPTKDQLSDFDARMVNIERQSNVVEVIDSGHCRTLDGTDITLWGNVGLRADLDQVLLSGLAGVGLFRTEFLYLQAKERPNTELQLRTYAKMTERLGDRPLVIRTFDLGGDKLPPFLSLDQDLDPAILKLRGLRFSLIEKHLLRSQLTAIAQVAQTADIKVLFPMVIGGDDFAQAVEVVEEVMEDCGALRRPQIGAMIETPAALFCLEEILELADFIAIGTNDLTQYMLAADRDLTPDSDAITAMHPAVLRAIEHIVGSAERWDCPVSVCGEEAGEPEFAELLIGLGVCELSVNPSQASRLRSAIKSLDQAFANELVKRALVCRSSQEVRELLLPANRLKLHGESDQHSQQIVGSSQ